MRDLEDILAQAYHASWQAGVEEPLSEAATLPREELQARLGQLTPVLRRCHISRVWADFLDRVLATKG